jgi:hypothetical protein
MDIGDYFLLRHNSHSIKLINHFCLVLKLSLWSYTSTTPYTFSVCSIKQRGIYISCCLLDLKKDYGNSGTEIIGGGESDASQQWNISILGMSPCSVHINMQRLGGLKIQVLQRYSCFCTQLSHAIKMYGRAYYSTMYS